MTPYEKRPAAVDQTARPLPTLGLLPVLAVSAVMAGEAGAQTVRTADEQDLGTILLQAGGEGGEAANSYKVTESDNDKATAPLLDTAKTVTVITSKQIKERGATSLTEILRTTPGVTLGTGEGGSPAGDKPLIRGFDAQFDIMVDGMRTGARTSYEAFNLETVEVAKGPDSTYAGRGSAGGSINLNTKAPVEGEFDEASLSFGTGSFKRATLDSNRSFGDLGLRLNLMVQDADDLGGRKGVTSERYGIAPSLSYQIGENSKVTAGLYYLKDNDMVDYGVPFTGANTDPAWRRGSGTIDDPYLPMDVPTDWFYGIHSRDFREVESASGYLRFEHDFSDNLRWTSVLRKNRDTNVYVVTKPNANLAGVAGTRLESRNANKLTETLSFNSQLSGSANWLGVDHSFVVGVDISREKTSSGAVTITNPDGSAIVTGGIPVVGWGDAPNPWVNYPVLVTVGPYNQFSTTKTRAVYAVDTISFSSQWEATIGLRYDDFRVSFDETTPARLDNNSYMLNGSAALNYKPAENGSVYLAFSTSSNPSSEGAGLGGNPSAATVNLDPERSKSYELGTKWSLFQDRLLLTGALFMTEKDNMRVTTSPGVTELVGNTTVKGVELSAAGQINDQWGIVAGYVYTDAELKDDGPTATNDGNMIAGVPKHSFSLWSTWDLANGVTLGGGATYMSKRYVNAANTAAVPAAWRVDLMASYALNDATSLRLNVNNVFDEQLYGGSWNGQFVNVEPGRNFTLSLNHSF
ncbi:TonB-dependent receptor [Pseudogemmobacter humi]|uniref:Putative TonB-dependent receptor BfrD n=1 Tax=Pseudogemmobacter humi TaxID=2483812 RepID=A0A3P5XPG9_9RHOB|nr:TonB-dependent siderophore receptor [Pseudogemmobacter humi]VDC30676.1 putative TonB-dependent receptor BfrD precursor [Pseudogemmobacter humi]